MKRGRLLIILTAVVCLTGCAHVISKDILKEVDTAITFSELRETPQVYQGKRVLFGGVIVKSVNKKDGTLLEVYQTEIDRRGKPVNLDMSGGRFLAHYMGFLDIEIYRKGRKVTIAGMVQGEQILRLGELNYHYPYLLIKDIHLWKEEQLSQYGPYHWDYWDPWGYPWSPWHDPYWCYW